MLIISTNYKIYIYIILKITWVAFIYFKPLLSWTIVLIINYTQSYNYNV